MPVLGTGCCFLPPDRAVDGGSTDIEELRELGGGVSSRLVEFHQVALLREGQL